MIEPAGATSENRVEALFRAAQNPAMELIGGVETTCAGTVTEFVVSETSRGCDWVPIGHKIEHVDVLPCDAGGAQISTFRTRSDWAKGYPTVAETAITPIAPAIVWALTAVSVDPLEMNL